MKWDFTAFTIPEECLQVHSLPSVEITCYRKGQGVLTFYLQQGGF